MKNKDIKDSRTEKAEEKTAAQEKPAEGELDRETMGDEKYIEALEHKVGELMAENASSRAVTLRLQADFDNYRKRNAALAEEMKALGKSMVIERLLGVLDNCALARKYITDEAHLTGFDMMERQLVDALSAFGLEEIAADGADFDPAVMSAVERVKGAPEQDGGRSARQGLQTWRKSAPSRERESGSGVSRPGRTKHENSRLEQRFRI